MKYSRKVLHIAFALVIFAVSAGTIWTFSLRLQRALTQDTYRALTSASENYNAAFCSRITCDTQTMQVLAGGMAEMDGRPREEIVRVLQSAVESSNFTKIVVCDARGVSCANTGKSVDVSGQAYFKKAMRGEIDVNRPLTIEVAGERCVVIAVPVRKEGAAIGVLFGTYPLSTASRQLLSTSYYGDGYGFVVEPSGDIVLSSAHADKLCDEKNLLDFFTKAELADFSVEQLQRGIARGESGSFTIYYEGQRRFANFMPSGVNDWVTFSLASDALVRAQEKTTNHIVMRLVLALLAVGIAALVWLVLRNRRWSREILRASERYQWLLEHINGGMVVAVHAMAAEKTIACYVSPGFTKMTGYTLEDIETLYGGRYIDMILEEDRKQAFDSFLEQIAEGTSYRMPYRLHTKGGGSLWVMDNGYLVRDAEGLRNHSIVTDISALKQQEEALRRSENRFSVAINASSGTLFEVDLKRRAYTHFENAERIFGASDEEMLARTRALDGLPYETFTAAVTELFFHPDDYEISGAAMQELKTRGTVSYEARLRRADGSCIWAQIDLSLSCDEFGEPARLVGFMSDIDAIKKQAEFLENKVQTDPLTGLYNKVAMETLADKTLLEYPNGHHALLILDIDNFKGINDTLGHAFGDLVLMEVSNKLKISFRNHDIVGRIGGDEFAILMKNVPDTSSVLKKATELSAAFRQTYAGDKEDYHISCSTGIIMVDSKDETFEALYRKADAALYKAKQNGKDQFVLYREQDAESYPIECARTNDEELQNLKTSHNIEAQIFDLLYTSKDFNVSINMALAAMGQQYHVSRVSIFESDEDGETINNIYEWCNGGVPAVKNGLQKLPILSEGESLFSAFDKNGLLYCSDVRELTPYLRRVLEAKGALSTLKVTIVNDEKVCGFIGFDECTEHRIWTAEEIEKLSYLSRVLSVFLFKKKTEDTLLDNLHTRLQILDILPDYLCVVNPETHSLVYANSKMQGVLPSAQPGALCFKTLRGGKNAPCEVCLLERIRRGDTKNLEIVSEDKNVHLNVNAMSIHWTNDKTMVLLYSAEKS